MTSTEWLTLGLLVVTAVYAALTYWLAQTTAKQVWENNRAQIVAALSLHQGGNMIHLVIKNVGRDTAKDCRLTVDCDVQSTLKIEPLKDTMAFKRPIHAVPSGSAWHYALGQPHIYLDHERRDSFPLLFTVRAEYRTGGRRVSEDHIIDIEALLSGPMVRDEASKFYFEMPQKYERQSKELAKALDGIAQTMRGLPREKKLVPYRSWSSSFRMSRATSRR